VFSTDLLFVLAWVLQDTIRENILLGMEMENEKYKRVIDCCALDRDLELLPGGDLCEVGEKGVSLSGGQRHRVALARAGSFEILGLYCD